MSSRVPAIEIDGVRGALLKRFARKKLGEVPEPLGVYWHNPEVLRSYFAVSRKTEKWNSCDKSLKSFAHMAVASMIGCTWCLDYGYFQARNEDLDMDKAREVPRWRESTVFSQLERDVLGYAEAMTATPPEVTDEMCASLLDELGPAAVVELTAMISLANFYARANVAFGIESDGFADRCGLPAMAEAPAISR